MARNLYIYEIICLFSLAYSEFISRISTGSPVGSFCSFSQCLQTDVVVLKGPQHNLQFVIFPQCAKHHNRDYKYNADYLSPDAVCEFFLAFAAAW
jgi:hypothetical protein